MRIVASAARYLASWWLACAAALAGLAFVVDGVLLATSNASLSSVLGGAVAAAALGALYAVPVGAAAAAVAGAIRAIGARRRRPGLWWLGLGAAAGLPVAWRLLQPARRAYEGGYVAIAVVTAIAIGVIAWLSRAQPPRLARAAAAAIAVAAVAADVALGPSMYLELHQVAHFVAVAAILAAMTSLRYRIAGARPLVLAVVSAAVVGVAFGFAMISDRVAPGWRVASFRNARHGTRLQLGLRALIDRDGDGYSPVAWGSDCDDGDARRHPRAVDVPGGGDANCNGVDPPANPGPDAFGLAPAAGTPSLAPDEVDLLLLVTIDTIRYDALDPALMPNLSAFAERGARFDRSYSAGSRTHLSVPLIHRATDDAPSVAPVIAASGVTVGAVWGSGLDPKPLGYSSVTRIGDDAQTITDAALARIRAATGPQYLWVHYYDPHLPTHVRAGVGFPQARPDWPDSYKSELRFLDLHLGRLFAELDAEHRLDRAVVIVTGDHGEAFGTHGVRGHGQSGYDFVIRVPGILVAPGVRPGRYAQLVSHRDLPATLLGAVGLEDAALDAERFGRSWLRLRDAPDAPLHTFVVARSHWFSSGRLGYGALATLVEDRYKLVAGLEEELLMLHDLVDDPDESENLTPHEYDRTRALWRRLAVYCDLDGWPASD
jgi:hypothetical protein